MKSQEEPLSDTDTSTDLELIVLNNLRCSQPHLHLHLHQQHHLQLHDCKLIPQNKEDYKSPDVQRVQWQTVHYLIQLHLLSNAITSFSTCTHQKDRYYPDYMNDKHARQNFKRKADKIQMG